MKALLDQHCGRMTDHPPHGHTARLRAKVTLCTCELDPCICTNDILSGKPSPEQVFHCPGHIAVEGHEVVL